jgi:guanylate kinase
MAVLSNSGKCVIFSAPSGAGKTTIVRHLLEQNLGLEFSISACSREPRGNEMNGKDYFFLGVEGFKQKISEDAFIEWEEVYTNNFYGTLKEEIERIWSSGKVVAFDVDVVGGLNLKKIFGDRALSIFVNPPSVQELEKRLRARNTETEEKIAMRLAKAQHEITFAPNFDVVVLNEDLDEACEQAKKVIQAFIEKP